jgi:putative transposase
MRKHVFTGEGHYHYVTFSCLGRRSLLATARARQIVISVLGTLAQRDRVRVAGFVIMPDHVHAVLWFNNDEDLPTVMQTWKRLSAHYLKEFYAQTRPDLLDYLKHHRNGEEIVSFWQRRYYDFNLYTEVKFLEKLNYLHNNPVKKGLVPKPDDYPWSSARWYSRGKSVGVRIDPGGV